MLPGSALRDHRVQCERAEIAVIEDVTDDVGVVVGPLYLVRIKIVAVPEDLRGQFAGVSPVDVHLEFCYATFWQAHDFLLAFGPAFG